MYRNLSLQYATIVLAMICFLQPCVAENSLPSGSAPAALEFTHFPDRLHTFIWRNWPIVPVERLAKVLETTPENVRLVADSMGLPTPNPVAEQDKERIYISILRRNWHILPYDQMLTLLDMTAEQLALALREDDFLFEKLGGLKPACERLVYTPPNESAQKRSAEIKQFVQERFGDELLQPEEKRFQFTEDLSQIAPPSVKASSTTTERFSPCYIYSYFALYGDPLMNPQLDPYPDGLLQKLSELGVDGIWMHTVLRQLAPSEIFPEYGKDCEIRLKNLNALVQRAKKYGIGIYIYVNEPRAMQDDFFSNRESLRGVREGSYSALCTSTPEVQQWLGDSLAYVFHQVPDLAGAFSITASENLTNCASHGQEAACPRCSQRKPADIIAEVNTIIEKGVHRGNPDAKVIAWDWGWNDSWAVDAIEQLPKSIYFMSVSEWSKPIERGGIKNAVGEYSISTVGPGPRATRHWAAAKKAGLRTIAKMQINNTWEISAVPYLPVLNLIAEHCHNLLSMDVNGLMLSWSLGGYPSPNLKLVQEFRKNPAPTQEEALQEVATAFFGVEAAPLAMKAWTCFSEAFREYPYDGAVLYRAPQQYGPANLLFAKPTGYRATMVGFPYDDVEGWHGPYPPDIFANQFSKIADGWKVGISILKQAVQLVPQEKQVAAQDQLRFAEAAQLHFSTVANQTRFCINRNRLLNPETTEADRIKSIQELRQILNDEIEIAKRLYTLTKQDSRIGYEASNQYYYLPLDMIEKTINCQFILDHVDEYYGKAIQ